MFATSVSSTSSLEDQTLHQEISDSVAHVIASGQWASYRAPIIDELKAEISSRIGVSNVRLCSSGSMAMELALRGCDLRAGDEVICPALDYPGNLRAIRLLGASPVIVDSAVDSWTLDIDQIENAASNRTRAIIVSHLYGEVADVIRLRRVCEDSGWWLIEDACQMPGASIGKQSIGSFGHVSAFSFGGSKPITSGTGGAVATDDKRIAQRIASYIDRPSELSPLSPLQAAVLLPQWKRIDDLIHRHLAALQVLVDACSAATLDWKMPIVDAARHRPCFYKVPIRLSIGEHCPEKKQRVIDCLNVNGISAGPPFRVVSSVVANRGRLIGFQNAHKLSSESFLLDHRNLTGPISSAEKLAEQLIKIYQQICH